MKILLVRPRLIGDVLLTTPLIGALRRHFPSADLVYVVESHAAPVIATHPGLSDIVTLRHRRGWRRWQEDLAVGQRLRQQGFTIAVDLHGGSRSAFLTWRSRAAMRVGYDGAGRGWMYTHLVRRPRGYLPRHSVRNQWDLLAPIDPAFRGEPSPELDRLTMVATEATRMAVAARLEAAGIGPADRIVCIHVAAGNRFRQWPPPSFAAVASAVVQERVDTWAVLVGGPGDDDVVAAVRRTAAGQAEDAGRRILEARGWPLGELRALFDRAALFVGGDSGPMHVAATTDIPIVAIFGPTLPVTWAPWRPLALATRIAEPGPLPCRPCDQRVCAPGDFRCMTATTPDHVIALARQLLEGAR